VHPSAACGGSCTSALSHLVNRKLCHTWQAARGVDHMCWTAHAVDIVSIGRRRCCACARMRIKGPRAGVVGTLLCPIRAQGATFGFFHDFLMTENYYVLLENPISLDFGKLLTKYMLGRACLAECLTYEPSRRTRVHLLARPGRPGAPPQKCYGSLAPHWSPASASLPPGGGRACSVGACPVPAHGRPVGRTRRARRLGCGVRAHALVFQPPQAFSSPAAAEARMASTSWLGEGAG